MLEEPQVHPSRRRYQDQLTGGFIRTALALGSQEVPKAKVQAQAGNHGENALIRARLGPPAALGVRFLLL